MLANWRMRPTAVGGRRATLAEMKRPPGRGPVPLSALDAVMPDLTACRGPGNQARPRGRAAITMLSSADRVASWPAAELGISAYLRKPSNSRAAERSLTALGRLATGPRQLPRPLASPRWRPCGSTSSSPRTTSSTRSCGQPPEEAGTCRAGRRGTAALAAWENPST
jgi:hypothetical protein